MISLRLASHLLTPHSYITPADIVSHYGCMQAQDIPQAMRVIWSRLQNASKNNTHGINATLADIKKACSDGSIVRTWPMRGTLHYMAPQYVHWMLDLCASKTLSWFAKRREFLGISDAHAEKALEIMDSVLRGGKALTRTHLGVALSDGWIPMQTQRVYHLTCYAATRKLICFWPPTEKEETFVLLDERIPAKYSKQKLTRDEQLAEVASMYIRSHGPATVDDLARRTGLGKGDCKQAIALVTDTFETITHNWKVYYYVPAHLSWIASSQESVRLLWWFDEYFIGYKDRVPVADLEHHGQLFTKNGIFFPLIMIDGKIAGSRKRTRKKNTISITIAPLPWISLPMHDIEQEAQKYADFRGADTISREK